MMQRIKTATRSGFGLEELPELEPIMLAENHEKGWRGLTELGEILQVNGDEEHPPQVAVGNKLTMMQDGEIQGTREVREIEPGAIDRYRQAYDSGIEHYKANELEQACAQFRKALTIANTHLARWNYGLVLLAQGDWGRGLDWYETRHKFRRIPASGAPRWTGRIDSLADKSIILDHELGFGDTIMLLRFVPYLQERSAGVFLNVPPVLERLAEQVAPITRFASGIELGLPIMSLLERLKIRTWNIPQEPYLHADRRDLDRWQGRLKGNAKRIGLAWSVGNVYPDDYPRSIPLELLVERVRKLHGGRGVELYSVQANHGDEAERCGVRAYPFQDFADCAALMSCMDEIWTVDTAALHLAGAIGHPRVIGLLSWWHSWRWTATWYPTVQMIKQDRADDWPSALAKVRC